MNLEADAHVSLVETLAHVELLVERRPGFDLLVSDNGAKTADGSSFAVTLESAASGAILREYRLPADAAREGRLSIAKDFSLTSTKNGFTGRYARAVVVCTLSPEMLASPP